MDNRRLHERANDLDRRCTGVNERLSGDQTTGRGAYQWRTKPRDGGFATREGRRTFLEEQDVM